MIDAVEAAGDGVLNVLFSGAQWSGADERSAENSDHQRVDSATTNSSGVDDDDEEEEEPECRVCRGEAVRFICHVCVREIEAGGYDLRAYMCLLRLL